MQSQQLHLFAPPKPLIERMGQAFFRAAPRGPGVYIMTNRNGRVLYVGQSKNLRARLASYKNARPDRAPRKIIRLIHAVDSIAWETCESAEAAQLRENELLRLHRPKFNSLNTYPKAYSFIWLRCEAGGWELGRTHELEPGRQLYGAFKTRAVAGYGALLRSTWAALNRPVSPHDFPAQLLAAKPPRRYRLDLKPNSAQPDPEPLLDSLCSFLEGTTDLLLQRLEQMLPAPESLSPFHRALQAQDLQILAEFYRAGPRRNYELRRLHQFPGPVIPQEQLDDLLVLSRNDPRKLTAKARRREESPKS